MIWSKLNSILFRNNFKQMSRAYYNVKRKTAPDENYLSKYIFQKIRVKGPLTIADYMKIVLTNPLEGYYMQKDMFGETGDFITSPEISQMFGEMLAIWFINEWQKVGSPKPLQIIELGPGRGTLCCDILKVFSHFKILHSCNIALVEISPHLSDLQARKLCLNSELCCDQSLMYRKGVSHYGVPIEWYKQLKDVPNTFSLILAHEFFDALPIHKFQRTYTGYKEVLVDIDPSCEKNPKELEPKFRYVLSRNETPMSKALLKPNETREHVEISPDSLLIFREICKRIFSYGGIALICDYGHYGLGKDTFRAFKKHKQVDPLVKPGTADLTADVDFKLIREVATEVGGTVSLGPSTQRDFLLNTGMEYRYKSLVENTTDKKQLENLTECFHFLVDEDKMGERFKFFALYPETAQRIFDKYPMVGFPVKNKNL